MKIYRVGGSVRDQLLNLPIKDRDWVVVGSTPAEMLAQGFQAIDREFPVFLHPETKEEYALARTEIKIGKGYKGFEIDSSPNITLEQDLQRRDITINAIAQDSMGNIIDPYRGQQDLALGRLHHITHHFIDDPARLLRIARFASTLGQWGFRIAHATHKLLPEIVQSGELVYLQSQRIGTEMCKALATAQSYRFFMILHNCGALEILLPEFLPLFKQNSGHNKNAKISIGETLLQKTSQYHMKPSLKLAILTYHLPRDTIKPLYQLLCLPKSYIQHYLFLQQYLPNLTQNSQYANKLFQCWETMDALRQPQRWLDLLIAAEILGIITANTQDYLKQCYQKIKEIQASELQQAGYQGKALGKALKQQRLSQLKQTLKSLENMSQSHE